MTIEFQAWPKIPRLFRSCVITEKIDGTNAAVGIQWIDYERTVPENVPRDLITAWVDNPEAPIGAWAVYAQSRKQIITPDRDNHNFAKWVKDNAEGLVQALGEGLHFGEWWGSGIQRGYGLQKGEKRFSLFNVNRYLIGPKAEPSKFDLVENLGCVPILYEGPFTTDVVKEQVEYLRVHGSQAVYGYMRPEGVITFHVAANMVFKTTLEADEKPKGSNE